MKQIKMRTQSLKVFAWLGICVGIYVIAMGVVMWIRVNQPPYNEEALLNHVSKILEEVKNGKTSVDVASVHLFELFNMFVYMIKKR